MSERASTWLGQAGVSEQPRRYGALRKVFGGYDGMAYMSQMGAAAPNSAGSQDRSFSDLLAIVDRGSTHSGRTRQSCGEIRLPARSPGVGGGSERVVASSSSEVVATWSPCVPTLGARVIFEQGSDPAKERLK